LALVVIVSCKKLDLKKQAAVKTDGVVLNSDNSVTANGTILDLGEGEITDHGHCWSLAPKPTPADNFTAFGSVATAGAYQSKLPPLEPGKWYLRAYLAQGATFYFGEELTITVAGFPCGTTLTDTRDGKTYSTVTIGTQCWMAANLNYGSFINSNGPDDNQFDNSMIEKYCFADYDSACIDVGGLYQWGEAMNYVTTEGAQGICPLGWHIPADNEWKAMEISLGMPSTIADLLNWRGTDEGTKIKLGGSASFEASGVGYRKSDGDFYSPQFGYFWTSTDNGTQAWARGVMDAEDRIYRNTINKSYGLCIRCLKD